MEYRALDINEINDLNQSVIADQAVVQDGILNYERYIRAGKAERARVTLSALRHLKGSIAQIFA